MFLLKVYLPTLVGHLPDEVILTMRAFLDFCYLVRRSVLTDATLKQIDDALRRYFEHRKIFYELGVQESFSVPRLHSLVHYRTLICYFGAPNGICTSITENKHIEAVKKPWRRSNRYNALSQMLKTNSRLDKLRASRLSFLSRGMLRNLLLGEDSIEDLEDGDNDSPVDPELQDQDDDGIHEGPRVSGSVTLALTPRMFYLYSKFA